MRKSFTASPKDVVTAPAPTAALTRPTPAKNDNTQLEKNNGFWIFDDGLINFETFNKTFDFVSKFKFN